ncbi:hypothetical protein FDECE_15402 [Fusarium decemcellulare]|nr:hypothetical protein FDECE_15402 [Fusarium decemcellulare]
MNAQQTERGTRGSTSFALDPLKRNTITAGSFSMNMPSQTSFTTRLLSSPGLVLALSLIFLSLTCSSVAYKNHMSKNMITDCPVDFFINTATIGSSNPSPPASWKLNGRKRFRVVDENFTESFRANLHVALSDVRGGSLTTECLKHGELMCYHNQNYTVIAGGAYHVNKGCMYDEIWHETCWKKLPEDYLVRYYTWSWLALKALANTLLERYNGLLLNCRI